MGPKGEGELSTGNPILDTQTDTAKSQLQALVQIIADGQQPLHSIECTILEICNIGYPEKPWPSNVQPMPAIDTFLTYRFREQQSWRKALYYTLKICYVTDPLRYPNRLDPYRLMNLARLVTLEGYASLSCVTDRLLAYLYTKYC